MATYDENPLNYLNLYILIQRWKYVAFISAFVGGIGLATYPIIIYPMTHIDDYKKSQEINRALLDQSRLNPENPGNMSKWTDPFDRKKMNKINIHVGSVYFIQQ